MAEGFFLYLRMVAAEVEAALPRVLAFESGFAAHPDVAAVHEELATLTRRGGKRMRAAMLALGYQAAGGKRRDAVMPAMLALELLQTYFLIHDDWMDGDTDRRGGPTVHMALGQRFNDAGQGDRAAILAGDWANALAHATLLECDVPPAALLQAVKCFAEMHRDVVIGQTLDVLPPPVRRATAADIERVYALKTGAYTVAGPVVVGAALAGHTALSELAYALAPIGVAFQLRDDWLGAFGDPAKTGKPRGSDLREGKRTPLLCMLGDVDTALTERVAARAASPAELEAALRLLEGAPKAQLEQRILALVDEGVGRLQALSLEPAAVQILCDSAVWLGRREH